MFLYFSAIIKGIDNREQPITMRIINSDIPNTLEAINEIIENNGDLDLIINGETMLINAIKEKNDDIVNLLIENGADVNIKSDDCQRTALMWASLSGRLDYVKLLFNHGALLDLQDRDDCPALLNATYNCHEDVVEFLINNGASLDVVDDEKYSALMWAVQKQQFKIIKLLVKKGASLDLQNEFGITALMLAATEDFEILQFLVNSGVNLDIQNKKGFTAIMESSQFGRHEEVELFIKNGASITFKCNDGLNAYGHAVLRNKIPVMYAFNNNIIHEQDYNGNTLLMTACDTLNIIHILFLDEKGADFHIKNRDGISAYDLLVMKEDLPQVLQSLKERLMLNDLIDDQDGFSLSI